MVKSLINLRAVPEKRVALYKANKTGYESGSDPRRHVPTPFDDDTSARELFERLRWPEGPRCPRCDACGPDDVFKIGGEKHSHREGLYQCRPCRQQFSVTVGTALERLRVSLSTWVRAAHAFSSEGLKFGRRGEPSLKALQTEISVSYPTVWRMRDIIKRVASRYKGYKISFGPWLRSLMDRKFQESPSYHSRRQKMLAAGKHPSQHTISPTHVLADIMSGQKPPMATRAAFDRTEVLLRLLLAAPANPAKRRRGKKRPRVNDQHPSKPATP